MKQTAITMKPVFIYLGDLDVYGQRPDSTTLPSFVNTNLIEEIRYKNILDPYQGSEIRIVGRCNVFDKRTPEEIIKAIKAL